MRFQNIALWPLAAQAINIISSNDDGWAEVNIRALFDSLGEAGHSVLVSAPAENQSGMGELCLHSAPDLTNLSLVQDLDKKRRVL